jgi:site-specific recombinase XerD
MESLNSLFSAIHDYLLVALPKEQKCSENTIRSYRKSLELLIDFVKEKTGKPLSKLTFEDINRDVVADFLVYLETERHCSISTRNHRLHCIRSFYRYAAQEDITVVTHLAEVQKVKKARQGKSLIEHMSEVAIQAILSQPNTIDDIGKRDSFLMLFLYRTGVRVQELVDIRLADIRIGNHPKLTVCGKGSKVRSIPLREDTVRNLKFYLELFHAGKTMYDSDYLFYTIRDGCRKRMTEDNVRYLVRKYGASARENCLEVPENVHPHLFRHSLAMSLYRNGVDLSLVSQWLGHSNIETTLVYAHADTEIKRQAIEKAVPEESEIKRFLNSDRYTVSDEVLLKQLCGLK